VPFHGIPGSTYSRTSTISTRNSSFRRTARSHSGSARLGIELDESRIVKRKVFPRHHIRRGSDRASGRDPGAALLRPPAALRYGYALDHTHTYTRAGDARHWFAKDEKARRRRLDDAATLFSEIMGLRTNRFRRTCWISPTVRSCCAGAQESRVGIRRINTAAASPFAATPMGPGWGPPAAIRVEARQRSASRSAVSSTDVVPAGHERGRNEAPYQQPVHHRGDATAPRSRGAQHQLAQTRPMNAEILSWSVRAALSRASRLDGRHAAHDIDEKPGDVRSAVGEQNRSRQRRGRAMADKLAGRAPRVLVAPALRTEAPGRLPPPAQDAILPHYTGGLSP